MHAESAGDRGDERNWGDVSRGAFMATGGSSGRRRHGDGPGHAAVRPITTLLEEGVAVGPLAGVDIRVDAGAERADRDDAVGGARGPPNENVGSLRQQARLIPHESRDKPPMRKALLDRVLTIQASRERGLVTRSGHNGCAIVLGRM